MLPTVLSLRESRLRLHLKVTRLNQQLPTRTHTRAGADGGKKIVTTRPKALCDGAKTTGGFLLHRARVQAIRMLASPLQWDQLTATNTNELPDVPPIEVNGRELSEKRGLTDRALRNHLKQLMQVGAIVKKKFRGTRANFYVYMNPELVWEAPLKAVGTTEKFGAYSSNTGSISTTNGKKVPDTEVLETLETPEIEITSGDKLVVESTSKVGTRNPLLETEARNGRAFKRKKNETGGGAITGSPKSEPAGDVVQNQVQLKKMSYVLEFWEAAKALVYPGDEWTCEQERLAKNAIWSGVYEHFHNYDNCDFNAIQFGLLQRLQLVQNYLQNHTDRYAPLPYSQHKPGSGYFDAANARGFAGTAAWLKTVNRYKQGLKVDRALRAAIKEIGQHNALARTPGIKLVANERVRTFSLLQLIKHHERGLKQLGNAQALDRFYAKLANKVFKSTFKATSPR